MEDFKKDTELGMQLLRVQGITYKIFKHRLSACFIGSHNIDEDQWVSYYNYYAYQYTSPWKLSIEEWAEEIFLDFDPDETRFWLKSKYHNQTK